MEIRVEAEICPECGVRQEDSPKSDWTPDVKEALDLMGAYYRHHQIRLTFHIILSITTGLVWLLWFLFFWIGTYFGWKDIEGMRELRDTER
jgi:hypothetical protein